MPTLICYDIDCNRLRAKLAQAILDYGLDRINKSVYLGTLKKAEQAALEKALADLMSASAIGRDSLLLLPITASQVASMRVLGRNELDLDDLAGERYTVML